MSTSASMTTLSQVMAKLADRGYSEEIKINKDGATLGSDNLIIYKPEELTIVRTYRFEGESDPADMSVLYVMETESGKKGIFLNAYGTYSDQDSEYYDAFILDVPIDEKAELAALGD